MANNPFQGWSEDDVKRHNDRVAGKAKYGVKPYIDPGEPFVPMLPPDKKKPKKRIRQSSKPLMNKLESEYFAILKNDPKLQYIRAQAKTYKLANGLKYTPDFSCLSRGWDEAYEVCFEVKGVFAFEDSLVKLKVAASAWPEVRWFLAWKDKGQWQSQRVLP